MVMKRSGALIVGLALLASCAFAQLQAAPQPAAQSADALAAVVRQLSHEVSELRDAVAEMRAESARYRQETAELRRRLETATAPPAAVAAPTSEAGPPLARSAPQSPDGDRLQQVEDELSVLAGKVDEQYQTKVESGSKYHARLSGMVLWNMFGNGGTVDNADAPFVADPGILGGIQGSFGSTLRQSQLRFEIFGPTVAGARTRADLTMDFAGGFPDAENGVVLGLARIRTATVHFDWKNTSIIAGQDAPFISPLSPTSYATLVEPAMSYSGNLWTWIPQVRVERRIPLAGRSQLTLQTGILDPLTGEAPPLQFERVPQAGEASRQPAFATRLGWSSGSHERAVRIGIGGYYSRQNWRFDRSVDGWAATADWSIPVGKPFTFSGEFYRGRAVGGLGGAIDHTVVFFGPDSAPGSPVHGVDSLGGWAQFKYQATPKLEFNVAAGQDNPFADLFRQAAAITPIYQLEAVRNRSAFINFVYRPRSNLLLSTEYRRIDTFRADSSSRSADHVNLAVGVLF